MNVTQALHSIFDKAIGSGDYDDAIRAKAAGGCMGEELFFEPAIENLQRADDLFLPIHERTDGVDGWVSLEVLQLLAHDTQRAAKALHARADRRSLFIKIPGTPEGLSAIEEAIASGISVNVTLLFSADHYRAAADAYPRGVERRVQAGHDPAVGSVASMFMSRWDVAVKDTAPDGLTDTLALAVGLDVYRAYREVTGSQRFQRLENADARVQRLLWVGTRTKDPAASDTLYVHGPAAPFTVNTMPDDTLKAFFDHGGIGETLPLDGGESEAAPARFASAGVDVKALAAKLQSEGANSFVAAWNDLMERIDVQSKALA
ncbi:transaldolase family protein [Streptomyces sp. NPDC058086]|uniref:transaldolase family protein n=1 Tax=Streptomyces sp. NPDC058086 TaxID=3346334 RepID=UPI0036EC9C56